ncbi:hypothetical protein LTR87_005963 [Friedmanniomyces endolithicus]|nr:hypothetical protein LTR87_005963 [Friedmanniomyces endolithicus]
MTVFAKFRGPKHSVRDHSGEFRKVRSGPDSSQPFTTLKRMILANVISSCSIFLPQEGFASANSSKRSIRSLGDMAESLDRRSTTIATGLRDSMPSLAKRRSSAYDTPPPFLPPRRPYTKHPGRPGDFRNVSPRTASPSSSVTRPSSSDYAATALLASPSAPCLRSEQPRPHSHPSLRARTRFDGGDGDARGDADAWQAEPLPPPSPIARPLLPRPRASFQRLSSLDNLISYREKKAEWKRESTLLHDELPNPEKPADDDIEQNPALVGEDRRSEASDDTIVSTEISPPPSLKQRNRFRSLAAEVGFAFTMAATAFLGEYLLSGIAIALPELLYRNNLIRLGPGTLGILWPASLLSLILSATLLVFARLADTYGGYGLFMAGLIWLGVWTLIPGFCTSELILDVARAMQGLAIAAFMPSTFVMVDSFYQAGPRRNFVLGLYSGCAPLGFFAGFLTAAALPSAQISWYFFVSSIVAFTAAITAYLTVPHDRTDRKQLGLRMDWLGAFLITAGLILVSYALAYEPSADMFDRERNGFSYPEVYGPFSAGMLCLGAAWCVERWYAKCPLLPFEFFKPRKSTTALCFANLCFYASYGVWLYESVDYFQSPTNVTKYEWGVQGIELAIWYTPTAVGGLILCVVGASLL